MSNDQIPNRIIVKVNEEPNSITVYANDPRYWYNLSKAWAIQMGSKVKGEDYSSKQYSEYAKAWAEGADEEVEALGGEHSAKGWSLTVEGRLADQIAVHNADASAHEYIQNLIRDEKQARINVDAELQAQINTKVDKVPGKTLTTNDFTNAYKNKLDGIETGAQVNTVLSVNSKTGNIVLTASDVGALPIGTTIGDATFTIKQNGSAVGTFTANSVNNAEANIEVPTKLSELDNTDTNFVNKSYVDDIDTNLQDQITANANAISDEAIARQNADNAIIAQIPAVGSGTITVMQDGELKGAFNLNQNGDYTLNLDKGGGLSEVNWGNITGTLANQTDLQSALDNKVDKTTTADRVYGTDANGDQTTYDKNSFGQVDDVTVGGTSVVTNKVAVLGSMAGETASDYSTTTVANTLYAAKSLENTVSGIEAKIPSEATSSNQLADKDFVNSSIATETANFIGTFENETALEAYAGTVTNNDYAFVVNSVVTDNGNDWADFASLDAYSKTHLTNFDYAWVVNGTAFDLYRFDIVEQEWVLRATAIAKDSVTLNTAYNRYKAVASGSTVTWTYEYTLNNSSFTAAQWAAINSGITSGAVTQITTNQNAIGTLSSLATTDKTDLVSAINEVNTTASGKVSDVLMKDTTIVSGGIATIPQATANSLGVVRIGSGLAIQAGNGSVYIVAATESNLINKLNSSNPVVSTNLDMAIREGLGNNSLTWTDAYKTSACKTIGTVSGVQINGTDLIPDTTTNKVNIEKASNDGTVVGVVQLSNTYGSQTVNGYLAAVDRSYAGFVGATSTSIASIGGVKAYVGGMSVAYNASQSLTDAQKTQARTNIGAGTGNTTAVFVDWSD